MSNKPKPLGNRVLIKIQGKEEKTKGGIYIPETVSQEKTQEGIIEAIGTDEAIKVKVGDKVIYDKYAGNQFKYEDQEYLVISYDDILVVL